MKSFKDIRNLTEKMRMPKAPFKGMHLTGFAGKFKLNQQSMHKDKAKEHGFKVGDFDSEFAIDIFPGFPGKNPDLPRGKVEGDVNLDDMVKDLGKLKSFGNFRNDFSDNWGEPGKG